MASTRFPGKPLAKICGIPMLGHMYCRCRMAASLDDVYVATCDREVEEYIESIGGKAVMTSDKHERATDRTAEAITTIDRATEKKTDLVVMIQGDEPMVTPEIIDALVRPMDEDPALPLANLMGEIKSDSEFEDPNVVKVVINSKNHALYFSREPIPSRKKYKGMIRRFKQIGIIAFRREFLTTFNNLTPTTLEQIESVDMLRVLEHGYTITMVEAPHNIYSVDTPEDLMQVEERMKHDSLVATYKGRVTIHG
jgi:3-deoxy-manno-octulosonate cytidylyltransferase (CMP-KDO synthetase)